MRFWAILCPPIAVLMARKPFQSIIALLLWLCLWVPGSIYAWGVVSDYKDDKRMMKQVDYQFKLEEKKKRKEEKSS
ncbi:YqaE/Pmp3 family membrane protein [Virgibacillus salexigens]|uniref:YqaE/Pmp3 family membrane protein n=1 Tax=Virgibacillus salexigens TaxID=61016 RepID=UPI00190DD206|nr:YqaE/Pmp3 family membrane protein [Virgibacillus salexigens]